VTLTTLPLGQFIFVCLVLATINQLFLSPVGKLTRGSALLFVPSPPKLATHRVSHISGPRKRRGGQSDACSKREGQVFVCVRICAIRLVVTGSSWGRASLLPYKTAAVNVLCFDTGVVTDERHIVQQVSHLSMRSVVNCLP